ncbi:GH12 family glycosyl hydrolase domain-containing protein [Streptomyces pseudovenezuelae]|uniref:GH12 family glycosyl hydrolase domain-containing protein n=1 Tax=Streptomyces pseudovenezuelae TaxID=67350 RepID=UPI0037238AFC
MKTRIGWAALLAALALVFTLPNSAAAASSTYWFKYYATGGNASTWYSNDASWGVNSSTGTGFVAMVDGKDWGYTSPVTTLPKKLSAISPNNTTWFSQTSSPASGSYYDATYDIFIDPTPAPTDRNSHNELMIWLNWSNTQPLANAYDASGNAIPAATNVSLGGRTWNIYEYNWPDGVSHTISYLDTNRSGWWSGSLTPFFNWGVNRGYYTNDQYLNSIMAGWEFGPGNYSASSWGVAGF